MDGFTFTLPDLDMLLEDDELLKMCENFNSNNDLANDQSMFVTFDPTSFDQTSFDHTTFNQLVFDQTAFGITPSPDAMEAVQTVPATPPSSPASPVSPVSPVSPMTPPTPPKYIPKLMTRGARVDKFFEKPLNVSMTDNAHVVKTLATGSDSDVLALPNLCCAAPTSMLKCEVAAEAHMFTQATFTLIAEYGVQSLADVYRHLGMMSDRRCISCPVNKADLNIGCMMGTFRCVNCTRKHGSISFQEGFKAWIAAGSTSRHGMASLPIS